MEEIHYRWPLPLSSTSGDASLLQLFNNGLERKLTGKYRDLLSAVCIASSQGVVNAVPDSPHRTKDHSDELLIQHRTDMDKELARLLEKNVSEVFGQPDRTLRNIAIADIYIEDCVCAELDDEFVGRDGINARAEGILELVPGCVLRPAGRAQIIGDLGFVRWRLGLPGAPPAISGVDVALFQTRKIRTLYSFIDPESVYTFLEQLPSLLRRGGYKFRNAC